MPTLDDWVVVVSIGAGAYFGITVFAAMIFGTLGFIRRWVLGERV